MSCFFYTCHCHCHWSPFHKICLSHISPRHLTVSECLSWTAVITISLALWVLELLNHCAWNKLSEREKWGHQFLLWSTQFKSLKLRAGFLLSSEQAVLGSFDRLFLSPQCCILDIKENSPNVGYVKFGICSKLLTEQLCGSFSYITLQTVNSLCL
jgi:hypothetical protein